MFDTASYEKRMQGAFEHLEDELRKVRTGRAHPSMLDTVVVQAYGADMPLNQVANVTVTEPQLLQVTPFDPSNLQVISAAIRNDHSLDMNPSDDGRVIRVPVPQLTEERRRTIAKQLGDKAEDARIAMRNIRQDALKAAKVQKEAKILSEDQVKRVEKEIDRLMSDFQSKIDSATKLKGQEVMTI